MANRFEEFEVWQNARKLVNDLYAVTKEGPFSRDFGLCDQIRRAGVSIMSNIAEGFERETNKEFIRYLFIAKGSVAEIRAQLYVAIDQGYIDEDDFSDLHHQSMAISKQLFKLINYLKNVQDPNL